MYMVKKGDDAGWPYVYYNQIQKKKIVNPEGGILIVQDLQVLPYAH
jgi:hypothetical protein